MAFEFILLLKYDRLVTRSSLANRLLLWQQAMCIWVKAKLLGTGNTTFTSLLKVKNWLEVLYGLGNFSIDVV